MLILETEKTARCFFLCFHLGLPQTKSFGFPSLFTHASCFPLEHCSIVFHSAVGWTSNCVIPSNSSRCVGSNHCLYCAFINRTDPIINNNHAIAFRTATTPPLDLRIITAVTPPPAPTNQWIKCSGKSM